GESLSDVFKNLEITPKVETAIAGNLRIQGTVGDPAVEATLRSDALAAFGQRFSQASLDAQWRAGELTVHRLEAEQAHQAEEPGQTKASRPLNTTTGQYTLETSGKNLRPDGMLLNDDLPLTGAFEMELHGKGALDDPAFNARVTGKDVRLGKVPLGELNA